MKKFKKILIFCLISSGIFIGIKKIPHKNDKIFFIQHTLDTWMYEIKEKLNFKSNNRTYPTLDFYSRDLSKTMSPVNLMHERLDKDKNAVIDPKQIERSPEFIIGYPEKFCSPVNDKIKIFYAGDLLCKGNYIASLEIYDALSHKVVHQKTMESGTLPLERQGCHSFYRGGCRFTENIEFPAHILGTGEYYAILIDDSGQKSHSIYFNIRPKIVPDSKLPKVIVMFPNHTWAAYNFEGGGGLYGILDINNEKVGRYYLPDRLYSASLNRPIIYNPQKKEFRSKSSLDDNQIYFDLPPPSLFHHSPESSLVFLKILKDENIPYITTSNTDLHVNPNILEHADVLVFTGHDEYWTKEMRTAVDVFLKRGGHIANFSGNICWWKINLVENDLYQDQNNGMIQFPKKTPEHFYQTGQWVAPKMDDSAINLFGVSYAYAGYPIQEYMNKEDAQKKYNLTNEEYEDSGNVTVIAAEHPVFYGTHLSNGSKWGNQSNLISVEVDGIPINEKNEIDPYFLPDKFLDPWNKMPKILATARTFDANQWCKESNCYFGIKDVGIFVEYKPRKYTGTVLSFGSIGYCISLYRGDVISKKIFVNSVRYLLSLNQSKNLSP